MKVIILDHGGRRTTQQEPVDPTEDGVRVLLDGAKTKAEHYLVEVE